MQITEPTTVSGRHMKAWSKEAKRMKHFHQSRTVKRYGMKRKEIIAAGGIFTEDPVDAVRSLAMAFGLE